ncbi:hypothetical protein DFH11DRAFT_25077 [Phellopilus nigrolimitatus]|nr:hypothetical protein DFH11DRAFT_25077 [Phellopilus nigrolimitatus]
MSTSRFFVFFSSSPYFSFSFSFPFLFFSHFFHFFHFFSLLSPPYGLCVSPLVSPGTISHHLSTNPPDPGCGSQLVRVASPSSHPCTHGYCHIPNTSHTLPDPPLFFLRIGPNLPDLCLEAIYSPLILSLLFISGSPHQIYKPLQTTHLYSASLISWFWRPSAAAFVHLPFRPLLPDPRILPAALNKSSRIANTESIPT